VPAISILLHVYFYFNSLSFFLPRLSCNPLPANSWLILSWSRFSFLTSSSWPIAFHLPQKARFFQPLQQVLSLWLVKPATTPSRHPRPPPNAEGGHNTCCSTHPGQSRTQTSNLRGHQRANYHSLSLSRISTNNPFRDRLQSCQSASKYSRALASCILN
jgi:hypothetical protein